MRRENTPRRWTAWLRLSALALCGVLLGINVYNANANRLVGNQLPMPFGVGAAVVLSGSMEPALSVDDLIIVRQADDYATGDVVVFQAGGTLVVHRIIARDGDTVTTQGDANPVADEPIPIASIRGKVVASIPAVGVVVNGIKTPLGTLCVIGAAIALMEIPRRREKRRDDDQRREILEEIIRLRQEQQAQPDQPE